MSELSFNFENAYNNQEIILKNPILPSFYSKLYFKIGLILDDGDLRQRFYYHISQHHNSILSPLLSLFEIKIFFQQAMNQLVFFNPEFWKWTNKSDPSARLSINHLRGAHSILIICDLNNYSNALQEYVKSLFLNYRKILHNNGQIPVFIVGCYNGLEEPNPKFNSFTLLKSLIPKDMKIIYTKINFDEIVERNMFQMFESFLFTEIYKELFFNINEVNLSGAPRLIWNTSINTQFKIQRDYPANENIKVAEENNRCIAHGGYIPKGSKVLQCAVCKHFYCESCYEIYLVSEICFGSLLSYKHRVVILDEKT